MFETMKLHRRNLYLLAFIAVLLTVTASAQTGGGKTNKRPSAAAVSPTPTPVPTPDAPKKNERPTAGNTSGTNGKSTSTYKPEYFYEFDRPGFVTSHVIIEHDSAGVGKISFKQKDFDEMMTDPIKLSPATVEGINAALTRLDFLASTTDYQYEKDLSHLGNIKFTLKRDGRERTIKYNWTEDKDAKFLMDEYRRITNEYVWKFEMVTVRENQPLVAPRMLDALDSLIRLNEISDPPHLIAFLKELSDDERLPLIARNHATRLIKQIEKAAKH